MIRLGILTVDQGVCRRVGESVKGLAALSGLRVLQCEGVMGAAWAGELAMPRRAIQAPTTKSGQLL